MSNPVTSATEIDWDKIAKRLGRAFDDAMDRAERSEYYGHDVSRKNLKAASDAAKALAQVAEQAQREKDAKQKGPTFIPKPAAQQ